MVAAAMTALIPGAGPPPTRIARVFPVLGTTSPAYYAVHPTSALNLIRGALSVCSRQSLESKKLTESSRGVGHAAQPPSVASLHRFVIVVALRPMGAATPGAAGSDPG